MLLVIMLRKVGVLSIVAAAFWVLCGCEVHDVSEKRAADFSITEEELRAYTELKASGGILESSREATLRAFIENNAVASLVADLDWIGKDHAFLEIKSKRNEILISHYLDNIDNATISTEMVTNYFENHEDEFATKYLHVAQLLVRVPSSANSESWAEKEEEIRKIFAEIAAGLNFEEAVKLYSDDVLTINKFGDIGWVTLDTKPEVFREVSSLNEGQVTEPVKTIDGYYIYSLKEKPKIVSQPLDSVRESITYKLRYQLRLNELNKLKKLAEKKVLEDMAKLE